MLKEEEGIISHSHPLPYRSNDSRGEAVSRSVEGLSQVPVAATPAIAAATVEEPFASQEEGLATAERAKRETT
jgi:hypothetical protein